MSDENRTSVRLCFYLPPLFLIIKNSAHHFIVIFYFMSTVNEEIAALKAKISDLEKRIAAAEMGGRSELRRVEVVNEDCYLL